MKVIQNNPINGGTPTTVVSEHLYTMFLLRSLAVTAAAASDTKMIHVSDMAPSPPSIGQFFVDSDTLDHFTMRCARNKTIKTHDLSKLPDGTSEQTIVDSCHGNDSCAFVVRTPTNLVECTGFELGDLVSSHKDLEETLLKTCGEEIGSVFQTMSNVPGFSTFIKIPATTDLGCRGVEPSPCLSPIVQKLVDEGVPENLFSTENAGVQATDLLEIDGPLSLLGATGHLSNVCFGESEFQQFKNMVLRAVQSQPSDMKKARLGAVIVRLAGHDLMDHDVNAGNGGSDGCILWPGLSAQSTEHMDEDNNGIQDAWKVLKPICARFSFSRADCIVIAAEIIITKASNNQVHFNTLVGRKDAKSCNFNRAGPTGTKSRLPAWFAGGGSLNKDANNLLRERLGLSWKEYVALLGVHNLGGISSKNSVIPQSNLNSVKDGMARWKKSWKLAQVFDSGYFRNLIGEKWFECDKGGKVLLQCNANVHGAAGGKQFFGIWNFRKADHGPTQLGPMANKGNHITKKQMIALSTDMAIASDIYSIPDHLDGEPCPGCGRNDPKKAPKAFPTTDYKQGDPRRQATAAVVEFAKNKQAFFTAFVQAWDKVTTNGFIKPHLKPLAAFPPGTCSAATQAAAPAPAPPAQCSHSIHRSCQVQQDCPRATQSKCVKGKCLCHKSECNFGGKCQQNQNFEGKRGGFSLQPSSFNQDGELSAEAPASPSSNGGSMGMIVGAAVCGSVATLFAVAGVAMMVKRREAPAAHMVGDTNMAAL